MFMSPNLEDRLGAGRDRQFKSEGEQKIAQFLQRRKIKYVYEQGVLVSDRGRPKIWHPDFHLPEFAVYVEYYGLAGNPDYDKGIEKKTSVYSSMGIDVIAVYPWTFNIDWQEYLLESLCKISKRRTETLADKLPETEPVEAIPRTSYRPSERAPSYLDAVSTLRMLY